MNFSRDIWILVTVFLVVVGCDRHSEDYKIISKLSHEQGKAECKCKGLYEEGASSMKIERCELEVMNLKKKVEEFRIQALSHDRDRFTSGGLGAKLKKIRDAALEEERDNCL